MKKQMGILLMVLLTACGSGGGGGSSSGGGDGYTQVKGMASTGDPLVQASIQVWDAEGKLLGSTVADNMGGYQLSLGDYAAPLLLKATAKDGSLSYYHVVYDAANAAGLRVNINQVSDLIVAQYLNAVQMNGGAALESNFAQVAPLLKASMYAQARDALDGVFSPIASSIAQGDQALRAALASQGNQGSVIDALTRGVIDGPLHTGLDNLLDHLHIQKQGMQATVSLPAVPSQAPIVISTQTLTPNNASAVAQAQDVAANAAVAAQLQSAPPTVIISSASAWGTKADNWAGYTGALALWVPKAVVGGWTLSFQSAVLAQQIANGDAFWNAVATVNRASNTITLNNTAYNATLAANQVLAMGFSASGVLDSTVDMVNCRFNGQACALVAQTASDASKTLQSLLDNFQISRADKTTISGQVSTSLNTGMDNATKGNTGGSVPPPSSSTGSPPDAPIPATPAPITLSFVIPSPPYTGGYGAELRVKNTSTAAFAMGAAGWQAQIKFPNLATAKDVFAAGPWNCDVAIAADGTATLTPSSWSAALAPASVLVCGFNGGQLANLLSAMPVDNKQVKIVFDSSVTVPPTSQPVPTPTPGTPTPGASQPGGGTTPTPVPPATGSGFNGPALSLPARPMASSFSLAVKGWGNKLEMGSVMIPEAVKDQTLANSGMKAIFKYAGDGGDGDPGAIYFGTKWGNAFYPEATKKSLDMARRVAALPGITSGPLGTVRKDVQPVMVVYTAQLSGGPTAIMQDLLDIPAGASSGDSEYLRDHYANLIIETALMLGYKTASNPYPGSLVMNPDMLGALQQSGVVNSTFRNADGSWVKVNVRDKLQKAIDYVYSVQASAVSQGYNIVLPASKPALPADLTDDIKGWFQSQNWVIKTFGQDAIAFGWQLNLWAQGSSIWVHGKGGDKNKPHSEDSIWSESSGQVAAFLDYLGVYQGAYVPDFLVFDRYEFDDFREPARNINYAYDAQDWKNYLAFVKQVSDYVQRPAMLWQIPASHLLTRNEAVPNADYVPLHSGTGGSFFMGDPALGVGAVNAASTMKSIPLNGQPYYAGKTNVGDWLNLNAAYDWTQDYLQQSINSNVFSILWGGGNTMGVIETANTGNDGGWMLGRVQGYYLNGGGKALARSGGGAAAVGR